MAQNVAVDHLLARESIKLLSHSDRVRTSDVFYLQGIMPITYFEKVAVIGISRHGRDLERVHMSVEWVTIETGHGHLVHLSDTE